MVEPIIACMADEYIKEFMSNYDPFDVDDVMNQLPLGHFNLTDDELDEIKDYIFDRADYLAKDYNYVSEYNDEEKTWSYDDSEGYESDEDEVDDDEDEDDTEDDTEDYRDSDTIFREAKSKGILTIPAEFVREIAEPGENLAYACYGEEVAIFPANNGRLMKNAKNEGAEIYIYTPHYTSRGGYEVRRTMNKLFNNLTDATNEQFEIYLNRKDNMIQVYFQ